MAQVIDAGWKRKVINVLPARQVVRGKLAPLLAAVDDLIAAMKPDLIHTNSAVLVITGDCNIHCVYCEYPTRYHGLKEFSTAQWAAVIRDLYASGVRYFQIVGGEPLLRPDWPEIVDACLPGEVSLTTNGTFITEKIADKVAQRFKYVRVSLDASNPETYEAVRRNTRFEHVLTGIKLLSSRGVQVDLSYVIIDRNVSDIAKTAQLAGELGIPISYSIVGFENNNRTATEDRSLKSEIDKLEVLAQLRAALKSGANVAIGQKVVEFLLDTKPPRCYSGAGAVMIDGLGDVYPCCGPTPPIGNLKAESWADIKARHDATWQRYRRMEAVGCNRCDAAVLGYGFLKAALGRR